MRTLEPVSRSCSVRSSTKRANANDGSCSSGEGRASPVRWRSLTKMRIWLPGAVTSESLQAPAARASS